MCGTKCWQRLHQFSKYLQVRSFSVKNKLLDHHRTTCGLTRRTYSRQCNILGIETSCDDTGVAIVNSEGKILGESLFSQQELHLEFGGIIPPVARDMHEQNIQQATNIALEKSGLSLDEIDAIAVTNRPGLSLSLLVGLTHAKRLAMEANKPLIPVHHMEAHALTIRMVEKVDFPFLVLLISGGHSLLAVAQGVGQFKILGSTFDDAPGEAFDKIARRLKLRNLDRFDGMSGGAALESAAAEGNPLAFPIAEPLLQNRDCNFSFAGIKNSSRFFILKEEEEHGVNGDEVLPSLNDMCASVQFAITKHLCRRVLRAFAYVESTGLIDDNNKRFVVSGGVACNAFIGRALRFLATQNGYSISVPPRHLCTDNGVMIAWNGIEKWKVNHEIYPTDSLDSIDIHPKCLLGEDISANVTAASLKTPSVYNKSLLAAIRN